MHRVTDRRATPRRLHAATGTACALAATVLLAACGGADEAAEPEPGVNPVEAVMAIDDARVAGVPLAQLPPAGPAPATVDAAAASAAASTGPQAATEARPAGDAPETVAEVPPRPAISAPHDARTTAPQPVARLQPGSPLIVDMEVTNATAGSEVGVVWYASNGREVWRQKRAVGDEPRLAFSADTTGWPVGLYRGEIRYGRVPVHQFAVQIGTPAPQAIALERGTALGMAPPAGAPPEPPAAAPPAAAVVAGPEAAEARAAREPAAASGPRPAEVPAAAEPATVAPLERAPSEDVPGEGAPVERIPPDDPNAVAPEGPPGPAPEAPPEPDEDAGDDEPPPGGAA